MDARCEICGCLTEEQSLTECEISGERFKICSYCKKSLEAIAENPGESSEQAVNIFSMENSHRSERAKKALGRYFASLGVSGNPKSSAKAPAAAAAQSDELKELTEKVEKLQNDLDKFKRRYFISKALEIAIPILLIVIVFIVMIASGALDNLKNYYDTILEYANM